MKGSDRIMIFVIFCNIFCTVIHVFDGNYSAALGFGCATLWSMRCHDYEIKLRGGK